MLNVVDLFAGPGGLSLGFEMVKNESGEKVFNLLAAVEKDPWACKTLIKNFGEDAVIQGDLKKESVKKLLEKRCKGKTDVVVAGPPCQSFSLIGPRSGNGKNGLDKNRYDGLYREFVEVVRRLNPKFIIFENVKGILSKKKRRKNVIDIIVQELKNLGYSCGNDDERYMILNSANYGVPQTRERVFIIGNNIGANNPVLEKTHHDPDENAKNLLPYITLKDAIGDLPKVMPKKTETHIPRSRIKEIEKYNKKIKSGKEMTIYKTEWAKKHLDKLNESGKSFFSFVRPSDEIPIMHHTARMQMETDILLFKGMRQGMSAKDVIESKDPKIRKLAKYIRYDMNSFMDKYKKQKWNRPCSTIFAHMQKDGNRFIHPDGTQGRTFTPREAARIQSFPDSYSFEGPMTKKFQQIGNAVPPLLSYSIAKDIFNQFKKES